MKQPQVTICPACGIRLDSSGVWRPRGDSRDVVVLFHSDERPCDQVFGTVASDDGTLVPLGTVADYRGDMIPIVSESTFLFDLTAENRAGGKPARIQRRPRPLIEALPWALALIGLAIPMIGSGFIGWPFVVVWLVLLVLVYLFKPLRDADRTTRFATGIAVVIALVPLGTFGGWYLIPAVLAWLALSSDRGSRSTNRAL